MLAAMPHTRLPDAELDVLAELHRRNAATARELREALSGYRPMAHGSVVTLLSRLEKKGLVTRRKGPVGKAFIFEPSRRHSATFRPVLRKLLQRVFGGDSVALVASLFETKPPTPRELQALQRLVADLRAKRR
jgi:BlaI family transcriptional regulator, penicillinase repressor